MNFLKTFLIMQARIVGVSIVIGMVLGSLYLLSMMRPYIGVPLIFLGWLPLILTLGVVGHD